MICEALALHGAMRGCPVGVARSAGAGGGAAACGALRSLFFGEPRWSFSSTKSSISTSSLISSCVRVFPWGTQSERFGAHRSGAARTQLVPNGRARTHAALRRERREGSMFCGATRAVFFSEVEVLYHM